MGADDVVPIAKHPVNAKTADAITTINAKRWNLLFISNSFKSVYVLCQPAFITIHTDHFSPGYSFEKEKT
jgi:hypothetical protein